MVVINETGAHISPMTHTMVPLPEAARQLGLSESILLRLSRILKIPHARYRQDSEHGSGDAYGGSDQAALVFNASEFRLLCEVRDRIVTGDSLETIRQNLLLAPDGAWQWKTGTTTLNHAPEEPTRPSQSDPSEAMSQQPPSVQASRHVRHQMGEQSFRDYKKHHGTQPKSSSTFQTIIQRVATHTPKNLVDDASNPQCPQAQTPTEAVKRLASRNLYDPLNALFTHAGSTENPLEISDLRVDTSRLHEQSQQWLRQEPPHESKARRKHTLPLAGETSANMSVTSATLATLSKPLRQAARLIRQRGIEQNAQSSRRGR